MAKIPLIALEIFLGFVAPLTWAVWELVSLRREQRRDREKAERSKSQAEPGQPPVDKPP